MDERSPARAALRSAKVIATPLPNLLRQRDWRARGFAAGVAAYGLGTARAFQVNELAGTFAGIGMVLDALLTAPLVPLLLAVADAALSP